LSWLVRQVADPIPFRWQHVLNWGGLRGAISLALALSLPVSLGSERDVLRVMAFGVVLFTLIVQSTTMSPLIRWLKVITRSDVQVKYEMQHARLTALRSADTRLDHMHSDGLLSSHTTEKLKRYITQQASSLAESVRDLLLADPALEAEELDTGWREILRSQRNAILSLRRDGIISEDVFELLTAEVDAQLSEGYSPEEGQAETRTQFVEITVPDNSQVIDKTIAQTGIPRSAVMVSIKHDEELVIPRGDTVFHAGDVVTLFCEREYIESIKSLFLSPKMPKPQRDKNQPDGKTG
jgi:NhaP-type Na+/H+ and K+/H+ antiporter